VTIIELESSCQCPIEVNIDAVAARAQPYVVMPAVGYEVFTRSRFSASRTRSLLSAVDRVRGSVESRGGSVDKWVEQRGEVKGRVWVTRPV
jgi:hypothetical protein